MAPSSDYTTTGGGLKLKGAKPTGVEKKKKKKPKTRSDKAPTADEDKVLVPPTQGKTEAEIRHEEMKRKRLNEKLMKEGSKTHKERVEELNRYLSGLSEHHDMPRIGPG